MSILFYGCDENWDIYKSNLKYQMLRIFDIWMQSLAGQRSEESQRKAKGVNTEDERENTEDRED